MMSIAFWKRHLGLQWEKYTAIFAVNLKNKTTYFSAILTQSIVVIIRVWIFFQLYRATYQVAGKTTINGMTLPMTIWVLMLSQSFQTSRPYPADIVEDELKSGILANTLNKPFSYILYHGASFFGRMIPTTSVNILLGVLVTLFFVGPVTLSFFSIFLGLILLFFGIILAFLIDFSIGLSAFWIEETKALQWMYNKGQLVLGGVILPLTLFPSQLRTIAEWLPFSQLFNSAPRIMIGGDFHLFWSFIMIQLIWIAFFSGLVLYLFNKGTHHVSINGG